MIQIIEQTDEEKMAMYMGLKKEKLAKMLIECNRLLTDKSDISDYYETQIRIRNDFETAKPPSNWLTKKG